MKAIAIIFLCFSISAKSQIKQDTIKVLLLCSDSINNVKVLNGYMVNKFIERHWENDVQMDEHWEFEKYLDEDKKHLSKKNVVWLHRERDVQMSDTMNAKYIF